MRRLRSRFPHCVHLEWTGAAPVDGARTYTDRLRGRDDLSVATEFVQHVRGGTGVTAAEAGAARARPGCGRPAEAAR